MQIRKILVPIDFSDQSRQALEEAVALAKERDASLTLMYVYQPTEIAVMDFAYVEPPEKIASITQASEKELERWAETLDLPAERRQVEVTTGAPIEIIVDASADHDLIVMATHGRAGLRHFLLGSVAERVIQGAHCSVLIVKTPAAESISDEPA